jgi:hypothetical protein
MSDDYDFEVASCESGELVNRITFTTACQLTKHPDPTRVATIRRGSIVEE